MSLAMPTGAPDSRALNQSPKNFMKRMMKTIATIPMKM
jgi:hypothetical protein